MPQYTLELHGSVANLNRALAASDEKYCAGVVEDANYNTVSYQFGSADCKLPPASVEANYGRDPLEDLTSVCCCGSREFCDEDLAEQPFTFTERVCANDCQSKASLTCPAGKVILITDAFYGHLSG